MVHGGVNTRDSGAGNVIVAKNKVEENKKMGVAGKHATVVGEASTKGRSGQEREGGVLFKHDRKMVETALHRVLRTLETRHVHVRDARRWLMCNVALLMVHDVVLRWTHLPMCVYPSCRGRLDILNDEYAAHQPACTNSDDGAICAMKLSTPRYSSSSATAQLRVMGRSVKLGVLC